MFTYLDLLDDLADFPIGKSTIYGGIYGEHVFFGGVGSLPAVDDNFSFRNGWFVAAMVSSNAEIHHRGFPGAMFDDTGDMAYVTKDSASRAEKTSWQHRRVHRSGDSIVIDSANGERDGTVSCCVIHSRYTKGV